MNTRTFFAAVVAVIGAITTVSVGSAGHKAGAMPMVATATAMASL